MLMAGTSDWFVGEWGDLWQVPAAAFLMLAVVIATVRVVGLRSFSKMSSFDFAVTVSIGSILGGVASTSVALVHGAVAAVSLLGVQAFVSWIRSRQSGAETALDNSPILLMDGARFLEANLQRSRVTRSDVIAKLREANVLRLEDIRAVVLETTGDISVLHGPHLVDAEILEGIRRGPAIEEMESIGRQAGSRSGPREMP